MSPEIGSVSLVLLGKFTPDSFTPRRLAEAGVISESDAHAAEFEIFIKGEGVSYSLEWCTINANKEKLALETQHTPYVRIADLALKALREIAPKNVVQKMGINRQAHYDLRSVDARDALGTRLAPPSAWGAWGTEIARSIDRAPKDPSHGGVLSLVMRQFQPEDRELGWLDIRVEPSTRIEGSTGVYVQANDHYEPKFDAGAAVGDALEAGSNRLLEILERNFDASLQRSERIIQEVLKS